MIKAERKWKSEMKENLKRKRKMHKTFCFGSASVDAHLSIKKKVWVTKAQPHVLVAQ